MCELFNGFDGYTVLSNYKYKHPLKDLKITELCDLESERPFNVPKITGSDGVLYIKRGGSRYEVEINFTHPNSPKFLVELNVCILIQALWHKKKRINKKWLKRYGMVSDIVEAFSSVKPINKEIADGNCCEYEIDLDNIKFHFRPDQKIKNRKKIFVKYDG